MKHTISIVMIAAILFSSCGSNGQSKAMKDQQAAMDILKGYMPGLIPASATGYYMKARVNGKDWVAKAMLPKEKSDQRNVYGDNNGERITFDVWMKGLEAGKKSEFKNGHAAAYYSTNADEGMWLGLNGEMEITKVEDNWVEGKFYFTATTATNSGPGKIVKVTDGFFRIPG